MLTAHNRPILSSNLSGRTKTKEEKMADNYKVLDEFLSEDKKLKAVLKHDPIASSYEVDFYQNGTKIASESYAFHTRKLVGVLGFEPSQEHSSSAKGIIRPSRVPTPTPLNLLDTVHIILSSIFMIQKIMFFIRFSSND